MASELLQSRSRSNVEANDLGTNDENQTHKNPPTSLLGTLKQIGPGLILAGGCVGSGELIATTSVGGKAGIALLWLIIFGCVIKVLVQIEFARYTIFSGRPTISAFNILPGPSMPYCCGSERNAEQRREGRGHCLIWLWLLVHGFTVLSVQAGILGGIGQALAMWLPVTAAGAQYNSFTDQHTKWIIDDTLTLDNGSSTLTTYRAMEMLWQSSAARQAAALADGRSRFKELCEKQATEPDDCRSPTTTYSSNVQTLVELLGGRQAARDAGADVNTRNVTQFFTSLGIWPSAANDDIVWALVTVVLTSVILAVGRYGLIQHFSTILVVGFTVVSIANIAMLQSDPVWRLTWSDILYGLSFHFSSPTPEPASGSGTDVHHDQQHGRNSALAMAMSTFGIIGVSTGEIVMYPYWCLEKGYAKFTGTKPSLPSRTRAKVMENGHITCKPTTWWQKLISPPRDRHPVSSELSTNSNETSFSKHHTTRFSALNNTELSDDEAIALARWKKSDQAWVRRARGWIRVLYWDAWLAMLLYTFSTIAFYLMGAAILHRTGLEPRGTQMIRYLAIMYEPAFWAAAKILFIIGAIAVLYSSLFINAAASGRLLQDALVQMRVWNAPVDKLMYRRRVRWLSVLTPWPSLVMVVTRADPRTLILFGGFLSCAFFPVLALAALYFYFVGIDDTRIKPGQNIRWLWNILLCFSAALICLSGVYACWLSLF